ncbi:MAG: chromophore lyase CpcT/CpeT [Phycisphaerales bacterium]
MEGLIGIPADRLALDPWPAVAPRGGIGADGARASARTRLARAAARLVACLAACAALGCANETPAARGASPSATASIPPVEPSSPPAEHSSDVDRLTSYMSGSFTSAAQAERDPEFRVIELHMTPIWTDRGDGHWLYVEQAAATSRDKPYRQRVYRLHSVIDAQGSGRLQSDVFEFAGDPLRYAGAWQDVSLLGGLRPNDLVPRDGCSIVMRADGDAFVGGTEGHGCSSALRGASYATSEVRITAGMIVSWDRGWDASGQQVWGAVKGGYEFVKVEGAPSVVMSAPAER